jgi:hypothetical protein
MTRAQTQIFSGASPSPPNIIPLKGGFNYEFGYSNSP